MEDILLGLFQPQYRFFLSRIYIGQCTSEVAVFFIGLWWYSVHYSILYLHSSRRRSILLIDTYRAQGHLNAENCGYVCRQVYTYRWTFVYSTFVHSIYIFLHMYSYSVYISMQIYTYRWTLFIVYIFAYICTYT